MNLYVINELNIAVYVLKRLIGRPVYILCVLPYLPPFENLLRNAIAKLESLGIARWARDTLPELTYFEKNPAEIEYAHIYPRCENEFNDYYRFGETDVGEYQMAFKHAVSSWFKFHLGRLPYLEDMAPRIAAGELTITGLPLDLWACHRIAYGHKLAVRPERVGLFQLLLNLVITATVATAACLNVLKRTTFNPPPVKHVPLGADLEQEPVREFFLQITESPDEVLFVLRNNDVFDNLDPKVREGYEHAELREGWIAPGHAAGLMARSIADSFFLHERLCWLPSGLFFRIATLVNKRVLFRAFFNAFHFSGFFARDEYNTDHIIRTQELRRAGIRSIGLTHGMSTGPRVYPHTRYLDFDLLYVFGDKQAECYAGTWSPEMTVRPIGAYLPTRRHWAEIGAPKTRDIVIFVNQDTDPPEHISIIREIIDSFSDRNVIVKFKYGAANVGQPRYDAYVEALGELPPHAVKVEGKRPYDVMVAPTFSFSGLSTVVAEALHFGMISFFIDVYGRDHEVLFRDYPGLCVSSAEEAVERIKGIEAGTWKYPMEEFADLIDLSGRIPFDVMRANLGLPPWPAQLDAPMEQIA